MARVKTVSVDRDELEEPGDDDEFVGGAGW
jgi:hypothetical protein